MHRYGDRESSVSVCTEPAADGRRVRVVVLATLKEDEIDAEGRVVVGEVEPSVAREVFPRIDVGDPSTWTQAVRFPASAVEKIKAQINKGV